jgi:hypothetical protein
MKRFLLLTIWILLVGFSYFQYRTLQQLGAKNILQAYSAGRFSAFQDVYKSGQANMGGVTIIGKVIATPDEDQGPPPEKAVPDPGKVYPDEGPQENEVTTI